MVKVLAKSKNKVKSKQRSSSKSAKKNKQPAKSRTIKKSSKVQVKKAQSKKKSTQRTKVKASAKSSKSAVLQKSKAKLVKPPKKAALKKPASAKKGDKPKAYGGYTADEYKKYVDAKPKYSAMSNDKLKSYLKANMQSRSGNKDILIDKCCDGEAMGSIPKCSSCGGGFLRFDKSTGVYSCPGYRDDEDYVNCQKKYQKSDITRASWVTPS